MGYRHWRMGIPRASRRNAGRRLTRGLRWPVRLAALAFGLQLLVGLVGLPRGYVDWMTTRTITLAQPPETIIVLGGGGIPSDTGLMRTYCAAKVALAYPAAHVICSLPTDGDPEASSVGRMRDELVMRGVPRETISLEFRAHSTHAQALAAAELLRGTPGLDAPLALVTSPSHARRTLLTFRKAGFTHVACVSAEGTEAEADMGHGVFLRYGFWSMLENTVRYARELVAIAYYRLRGWA
jgi:uncharacterized SAM-binding protein YcdF (DUF218 family)